MLLILPVYLVQGFKIPAGVQGQRPWPPEAIIQRGFKIQVPGTAGQAPGVIGHTQAMEFEGGISTKAERLEG